jgi:4-coumarate--CoA ligase
MQERNDQEWPWAYISLQDSHKWKKMEQHIQIFMKEKVAKHKQLIGGMVFVNEIPRLASRKIIRKIVKGCAERDAKDLTDIRANVGRRDGPLLN